jgi:hypothetical protein
LLNFEALYGLLGKELRKEQKVVREINKKKARKIIIEKIKEKYIERCRKGEVYGEM